MIAVVADFAALADAVSAHAHGRAGAPGAADATVRRNGTVQTEIAVRTESGVRTRDRGDGRNLAVRTDAEAAPRDAHAAAVIAFLATTAIEVAEAPAPGRIVAAVVLAAEAPHALFARAAIEVIEARAAGAAGTGRAAIRNVDALVVRTTTARTALRVRGTRRVAIQEIHAPVVGAHAARAALRVRGACNDGRR